MAMESSSSNIIAFIGKQLRYRILTVPFLVEFCLAAFSTEEIIEARNTVLEAFCEITDYSQPRDLQTQSSRNDLLSIISCLKDFPCAVGEERHYTNNIRLRSAFARIQGLIQLLDNLKATMSSQSTSVPDSDNVHTNAQNNTVEQAPRPTTQPVVQPEVIPVNPEIQAEIPTQDDGPEAGPLPDPGLQSLSFNPPPNEQEGVPAILEPIVNVVEETVEQPKVAAIDKQAPQEDNPDDNVKDENASNDTSSSSITTSTSTSTTSSDFSDEDNLPLIPFYRSRLRNKPIFPMVPEQSLPRREGLPPASKPIPPPIYPLPAEVQLSEDSSSSSDSAPSSPKRRRLDRPH